MSSVEQLVGGACHCGDVRLRIKLPEPLTGTRCNCSICSLRGAVMLFVECGHFEITAGTESLTTYRFNTEAAAHFFCSRCGVYTHHQRRFDPRQISVNAACLEGISPFDFAEVRVVDGANHPLDTGGGPLKHIGTLRFERLE